MLALKSVLDIKTRVVISANAVSRFSPIPTDCLCFARPLSNYLIHLPDIHNASQSSSLAREAWCQAVNP